MGKDDLGNSAPLALRDEEEERRKRERGEGGGGIDHSLDGDEIKAPDSELDMHSGESHMCCEFQMGCNHIFPMQTCAAFHGAPWKRATRLSIYHLPAHQRADYYDQAKCTCGHLALTRCAHLIICRDI